MSKVDSDFRYRPTEQEVGRRGDWIPLQPNLFPEGSVGHTLLSRASSLLAGRSRPATIFDQPLLPPTFDVHLWNGGKVRSTLQSQDLQTVRDILTLPDQQFSQLYRAQRMSESLHGWVERLALTPHARLLRAIFSYEPQPLSPSLEEEFMGVVEEALGTLNPREEDTLVRLSGLRDGILRTREEVGKSYDVTKERIRQIKEKALRKLRHPNRSRNLTIYTSYPEESLGRHIFGDALRRDLPQLQGTIGDLALSQEVREALAQNFLTSLPRPLESLAKLSTSFIAEKASEKAVLELEDAVRKHVAMTQEKARQVEPAAVEVTEQKTAVNNLLLEIQLTEEQLAAVAEVPLERLDLGTFLYHCLMWHNVKTVGDIFRWTRKEFVELRGIGLLGAYQFGMTMQKLLNLPQESYSRGYIARLFIESSIEAKRLFRSDREKAKILIGGKELFDEQLVSAAQTLRPYLERGITDPDVMQTLLMEREERLLSQPADSLIGRAIIEYAINHPQEFR